MTRRLTVVVASLGSGGAEHALFNLLSRLDRNQFESSVMCLQGEGELAPRFRTAGIAVRALDMRPGRWPLGHLGRARSMLRELSPDLLLGWMYHGNLAAAALVNCLPKKVSVLWAIRATPDHQLSHSRFTGLVIQASRLYLKRISAIYCNSQRSAALMQSRYGYPADQMEVLPNGVDIQRFVPDAAARTAVREELGLAPDTPLVGMVARWHPVKNHACFMAAAKACKALVPDAHFVLVGEGCEMGSRAFRQLIDAEGLRDCVHGVGAQRIVERWNAAFDVAALSSDSEAFPNVLIEAMACGVPVVSTDVGDAQEIVGEAGRIVPVGDAARLGAAMAELLCYPVEERVAIGEAGRARVIARYDLEEQAAGFQSRLAEWLQV